MTSMPCYNCESLAEPAEIPVCDVCELLVLLYGARRPDADPDAVKAARDIRIVRKADLDELAGLLRHTDLPSTATVTEAAVWRKGEQDATTAMVWWAHLPAPARRGDLR